MDEVGDLGGEAQAKLLRAIEAKEIERVGGGKPIPVNVRIVAATNKDLERNVAEGSFREDLYFRLNVIPMQLPPLRDRVDDIDALVLHFSALGRARGYPAPRWTPGALELMRRYRWPGNVRELANIVERLGILHAGADVTATDVGAVLAIGRSTPSTNAPLAIDPDKPLGDALDDYERELISRALTAANGNVAEAARRLRTDRPNLYRRMRRLSIEWTGA
jgi:transcriptional regulator with GAF, ATPase, and Fis domain